MLHHISWNMYLLTVILLLAAYYLVVVPLCYKQEITVWIKGLSSISTGPKGGTAASTTDELNAPEELTAAARAVLQNAPSGLTKVQLITLLKTKLAGRLIRASPDSRLALFRYIMDHSEAACGIRLTGDDLSFLAHSGPSHLSNTASTLSEPSKNTHHVQ